MNEDTSMEMWFRAAVNVPVALLVLFPLSIQRDMSSLAFAGLMSILALVFTLLVVMGETPSYYINYHNEAEIEPIKLDWNFFTSCALIFFSFTC